MTCDLDPRRLDAFETELRASSRVRIDHEELWSAFARAFPGRPQGVEERRWFVAALAALALRGVLRLPPERGRRWDRSHAVAVPRSVDLIRDRRAPSTADWRTFPWHPRLDWVAELPRLSPAHERFLRRVHEGLVASTFLRPAPLKYRSLQLTGDEKRLLSLSRTSLFAAGRLDFDLLGCYREVPPVAWEEVSARPVAIVFENAGPFTVALEVLRALDSPPYGLVVYGGGRGFELSVRYLRSIEQPLERIEYVGDLDRAGLEIAASAREEAARVGLAPIVPASTVHAAMLRSAAALAPSGSPPGWPDSESARVDERPAELGLAFLDDSVRERVAVLLAAGLRVPEEVLGPAELSALWNGPSPAGVSPTHPGL